MSAYRVTLAVQLRSVSTNVRTLRENRGQRVDEKVEAFVGVERADETDQGGARQAQRRLERVVGHAAGGERVDVHRVGNDRHVLTRDAARDDFVAQAFAD